MNIQRWHRREVLRLGTLAAASGLSKVLRAQQLPPLEELGGARFTVVTTTATHPWQPGQIYKPTFRWDMLNLNISPDDITNASGSSKTMQGFGACFNELGWIALQKLSTADCSAVLRELFDPLLGACFSYCRMPIGANDFSTGAYSYDEVDGDFELKHFSVDHDRSTLIPFIHAAQAHNPNLRLWASPWTPPSWMKKNNFYAEAAAMPGLTENGIHPDQIGHEGQDFLKLEPRYLEAYARYFRKFIEAYRAEQIRVDMVMPQNEFNSAQNFPSCTWTPQGLLQFLRLLGPEMQAIGVDVFFGTLERGNPALFEAVQSDPVVGPYLKGVGVQWAGKNALPALQKRFPALPIYGSEQECGDGANSWEYTGYCWDLMKTYFRNGTCAYMYWNIALEQGGKSTWGWPQNSLVVVDAASKSYRYTPDYYLLKHLTHFVRVGASFLPLTGTCDNALAFRNQDGTVAILLRNELPHAQLVQLQIATDVFAVELAPNSISTIRIAG